MEPSVICCSQFNRFEALRQLMSCPQIIVGTIATRAPSSTMAPAAQLELDLALNLFKSGAVIFPRAKFGMVGHRPVSIRGVT